VFAGDGCRGGKREARGGRGRGGVEEEAAVERVQGAPGGGEGGRHGMGESRSGRGVNRSSSQEDEDLRRDTWFDQAETSISIDSV
jgi:hypothetical protein